MGKGNGSTRASSSGSPRGLNANYTVNGERMTEREFLERYTDYEQGRVHDTSFSRFSKLIDFNDEGQMVNGGSYSIETDDGYTMRLNLENGYNENYGSTGTLVTVTVTSPSGKTSEPMGTSFVEGAAFRESGGRNVYANSDAVRQRIEGSMPYYAELANRWKRNNK